MSFIVAMGLMLPPVKRLASVNSQLQRGIVAAASLFELLDSESEQDHGTRTLVRAKGKVEYRHLTHVYDPDKGAVIHALNLCIAPGESVALVGRSGSGKSTLASLLPRFYDVTEGAILIDGIDTRALTLASLRRQISLVTQDIVLFNDSVANNIAYGADGEVPHTEVERVAEAAHALDFIRALPQGFDTLVGDRGVLLSGGQRQRIAIARAMLKDAPILVLDEATSALDAESETPRSGGARASDARPHHAGDRASPLHHRACRSHCRARRRAYCRAGAACRTAGQGRLLHPAASHAVSRSCRLGRTCRSRCVKGLAAGLSPERMW